MLPSLISLKFFEELEIVKKIDINDLKRLQVNFSAPNRLEIIVPYLLAVETVSKLLYLIYHKLNYLFDYFDYQIAVQERMAIDKKVIQEFFSFVIETPFLWKDKRDLTFFCEQKKLLENFIFRRNVIRLRLPDQPDLSDWKIKLAALNEILAKLGLTGLRFGKEKKW